MFLDCYHSIYNIRYNTILYSDVSFPNPTPYTLPFVFRRTHTGWEGVTETLYLSVIRIRYNNSDYFLDDKNTGWKFCLIWYCLPCHPSHRRCETEQKKQQTCFGFYSKRKFLLTVRRRVMTSIYPTDGRYEHWEFPRADGGTERYYRHPYSTRRSVEDPFQPTHTHTQSHTHIYT